MWLTVASSDGVTGHGEAGHQRSASRPRHRDAATVARRRRCGPRPLPRPRRAPWQGPAGVGEWPRRGHGAGL
ncbi:hypothetical protein LT493_10065 [Streptomyces tricolor]|nr:hypothetical protein [Streptomyces tricolor]